MFFRCQGTNSARFCVFHISNSYVEYNRYWLRLVLHRVIILLRWRFRGIKKRAGRCLAAGFYMVLLFYCDIIHSLFHRSRCISNEWSLKTFRHLSKLCYVSGRKPPSTLLRYSLVTPCSPSCGVPSFGTCLRQNPRAVPSAVCDRIEKRYDTRERRWLLLSYPHRRACGYR